MGFNPLGFVRSILDPGYEVRKQAKRMRIEAEKEQARREEDERKRKRRADQARTMRRDRSKASRGRRSTILTGAGGLGVDQSIQRSTLLGG